MGWVALAINEKRRKVPSDIPGFVSARKFILEKAVDWPRVGTIYMALREPSELLVRAVLAREFKNLFVGSLKQMVR